MSGCGVFAYTSNDPVNGTDPSGEWCVFGIGTSCAPDPKPDTPSPPPANPAPAAAAAAATTMDEIVVTAPRAAAQTEVEPFILNPIGLLIFGPFIPGRLSADDTCASGKCNTMSAKDKGDKPSDKSRQSKPASGVPAGTKPIDQSGKSRDWIHGTKEDVGAGAKDWVGVAPNGDIITTNPDGTAENHGPSTQ